MQLVQPLVIYACVSLASVYRFQLHPSLSSFSATINIYHLLLVLLNAFCAYSGILMLSTVKPEARHAYFTSKLIVYSAMKRKRQGAVSKGRQKTNKQDGGTAGSEHSLFSDDLVCVSLVTIFW